MSISKRQHYLDTISDSRVSTRLVEETGMAPDLLAAIIDGYFSDLIRPPPQQPVEVERDTQLEMF